MNENIPNNEIWYWTTDGEIIEPYNEQFDANLISNTYVDGKGVMRFDDELHMIGAQVFYRKYTLKSIVLPNTVNFIKEYAFDYCTYLESIELPYELETIGEFAFAECEQLDNIVIPDSIQEIDRNTFIYCRNLKSISLGEGVSTIKSYAFYGCTSLEEIELPSSILQLDAGIFYECINLKKIKINGETPPEIVQSTFREIAENGVLTVNGNGDYETWMSDEPYYLGYYGWTLHREGGRRKQQIVREIPIAESLDFNRPSYTFIGDENSYPESATLYSRYWKGWIDDIYSIDAKKVTLYCFLNGQINDIVRRFYYFDNSIWIISELNDYIPSSSLPTKVTFVKVNDKNNIIK